MSYLDYPRLYFSGSFKAYPSTINNYTHNYNPNMYPEPNQLSKVQLGWGPKGDGSFDLKNCVVTRVDYDVNHSATTSSEDPIIGQPIAAIANPSFPLSAALVDLDPQQQAVSEIWGMTLQIGSDAAFIRGYFSPAAFNSMWGNVQGPGAPQSSASASATYQSTLRNIETSGLDGNSKFLNYFSKNPASALSINFVVNAHNNNPQLYAFNKDTFQKMGDAGVSTAVLTKIQPMQHLVQDFGDTPGNVPTEAFVTYQLQQYLSTDEYNASISLILKNTILLPYTGYTSYPFTFGFIAGTIGTAAGNEPEFFVPSRMMAPQPNMNMINFAPFAVSDDGHTVSINLSNSLAVKNPGVDIYQEKLGTLLLVSFPNGDMSAANANKLVEIPYTNPGFMTINAGIFAAKLNDNLSETPLGILSIGQNNAETILLQENKDGYYLRANQFVFRMNPGVATTPENPRGKTATVEIHVLKFGKPVPDKTRIAMADINPGVSNPPISTPENALTVSPASGVATTVGGIAKFKLKATDPGNPRGYINGQLYFKSYGFKNKSVNDSYIQDPSDFISIQIYNQVSGEEAINILNKYGRLYKIMGFLADDEKVEQPATRNMIKTLLSKPMADTVHMPVTRDLSDADKKRVIDWINGLNKA